jgi:hypothetical protein
MDRRQLLFGASALGLATNLNLNHPLIAQVGNAVMGSRRLSDRERAGLRGPVKTCIGQSASVPPTRNSLYPSDLIINTDYSQDGRLLGYRLPGVPSRAFLMGLPGISDKVDVTFEFCDKRSNKTEVRKYCLGVTDEFQYDARGRKTRVRKVCSSSINGDILALLDSMKFEFAEAGGSLSEGGTVTTRYNENDQPIESLVRNSGGELLTKINHNYTNGRLISETLVIVREHERLRQMRAAFRQLQGLRTFPPLPPVERSYIYDADDRVIRRLTQAGNSKEDESKMYNFKEDESKTYNAQGDEDWTLTIRSGSDDVRSEFRYLYQYDSHGNWTERTKINTDQPDNPNTQRRTLSYYGSS